MKLEANIGLTSGFHPGKEKDETPVSISRNARLLDVPSKQSLTQSSIDTQASAVTAPRRTCCVFLVHNVEAIDAVADVYFEMKRSSDFDVVVLSIPRRYPGAESLDGEEAVHLGLEKIGIEHERFHFINEFGGVILRLRFRPAIVFRQTPWDNDIQPGFAHKALLYTKVCYIPYALPLIERYLTRETLTETTCHFNNDFLQSCWRIFCETNDSREMLGAGVMDSERLEVVGSPKLDRLRIACQGRPLWPINQSDQPRRYRIIWAPHHSIGADWLGFGVFIGLANHMINWAANDSSIEIVLKPHPALFDQLRNIGASELVERFQACWSLLPNVATVYGGDYGSLFAGSDAMITDGISFLVEYLFADKPLIFVDSGRHVPFNKTGRHVIEAAYKVSEFNEIKALVDDLKFQNSDRLQSARRAVANDYFQVDGHSSLRIVESLRRSLAAENIDLFREDQSDLNRPAIQAVT